MSQNKGNKAKHRRSAKNAGRYKDRFFITTRNKLRREKKRNRLYLKRQAKAAAKAAAIQLTQPVEAPSS